jgi:hypothetical protein
MNVFIRGMDLQPADLLAVSPAIIREHHNVIMDTLKSGIGQAAVKLDNRAELSIKVYRSETTLAVKYGTAEHQLLCYRNRTWKRGKHLFEHTVICIKKRFGHQAHISRLSTLAWNF